MATIARVFVVALVAWGVAHQAQAATTLMLMPDEAVDTSAEAQALWDECSPLVEPSAERNDPQFERAIRGQSELYRALVEYRRRYGRWPVDSIAWVSWDAAHRRLDEFSVKAREAGEVYLVAMPSSWTSS